jgi:hypothetical protein
MPLQVQESGSVSNPPLLISLCLSISLRTPTLIALTPCYTMLLLSSHSTIFLCEIVTVLQHGHPAYTDQEPADQGQRQEVGRDGDAERRIGSE